MGGVSHSHGDPVLLVELQYGVESKTNKERADEQRFASWSGSRRGGCASRGRGDRGGSERPGTDQPAAGTHEGEWRRGAHPHADGARRAAVEPAGGPSGGGNSEQ